MNKQELIKKYEYMNHDCFRRVDVSEVLADLRQLDEPQPLRLKDVIARIKFFESGTQKVWLNEILSELGSDYGTLKYKAGYDRGKLEGERVGRQLKDANKIRQELNKPVVPQYVADWYEANKDDFETNLFRAVDLIPSDYEEGDLSEFEEWLIDEHTAPFQTLVNMHQFGYTVEKEKRYLVKMKGIEGHNSYLKYNKNLQHWYFGSLFIYVNDVDTRTYHTRKELEESGFGEAFNSPLFEVEEVE